MQELISQRPNLFWETKHLDHQFLEFAVKFKAAVAGAL
jgi:hypothetical protein